MSVDTVESTDTATAQPGRVKLTPGQRKAVRIARAEKRIDKQIKSGAAAVARANKAVETATKKRDKAAEAQRELDFAIADATAKETAHETALAYFRQALQFERNRPVRGEAEFNAALDADADEDGDENDLFGDDLEDAVAEDEAVI